eukprot:SAG11_NODE_2570_length_3211_cov_4.381427_1_plen_230_part_00
MIVLFSAPAVATASITCRRASAHSVSAPTHCQPGLSRYTAEYSSLSTLLPLYHSRARRGRGAGESRRKGQRWRGAGAARAAASPARPPSPAPPPHRRTDRGGCGRGEAGRGDPSPARRAGAGGGKVSGGEADGPQQAARSVDTRYPGTSGAGCGPHATELRAGEVRDVHLFGLCVAPEACRRRRSVRRAGPGTRPARRQERPREAPPRPGGGAWVARSGRGRRTCWKAR